MLVILGGNQDNVDMRLINKFIRALLKPVKEKRELYRWASTIDSSREGMKRIASEYKTLFEQKGLTLGEYYDFEFEKRSSKFKKDFLGLNEQRVYVDYLNPKKYYSLARNKYLAHRILDSIGVRKSTLYCYYQPEARYLVGEDNASSLGDVLRILQSKDVTSCVIKTTESSHGDNVWVINDITYQDNDALLTRFDGEILMLSSVLGQNPLVFESKVHQTKQLAALNESSVNTVRFMTTLWPNGEVKVVATFLKIGRLGKCVDNAGGGGNVDACVDVETGELRYAIQFDGWRNNKEIETHPDNGHPINGIVIDNWQNIKEEVKQCQRAFPFCKAAGWDIAITDDGPVIIEVNDFWDRAGQFFIRRGWRNDIRDCYFAWKKTGKSYIIGRDRNRLPKEMLEAIIEHE